MYVGAVPPVINRLSVLAGPSQVVAEIDHRNGVAAVCRSETAIKEHPGAVRILLVPHTQHPIGQLDGEPHPHRAALVIANAP